MKRMIANTVIAAAMVLGYAGCAASQQRAEEPAPAEPPAATCTEPRWEYHEKRCGFQLTKETCSYHKRLDYTFNRDKTSTVGLYMRGAGRDEIEITAEERIENSELVYSITRIQNRTGMESCYGDIGSMACSPEKLAHARELIEEHMEPAKRYVYEWLVGDRGRCDILGGW